ncbi:hypothetical protein DITRI_Ditri17bG0084800 [Diplodiscus trichospermus]
METTQKRGFFKGNLPKPFSRAKKLTTPHQVVPCSPSISNSGVFTGQNLVNYPSISRVPPSICEQKNVANLPSLVQKVSHGSIIKPPSCYDQNGFANDTWGHGDLNVDINAATYILGVRKRFEEY